MNTTYNPTTAIIGIAVVGITTVLLIIIWEAMKAQAARYKASQASRRKAPRTRRQREVETLNTYSRIALDPALCVKYGQQFGVPEEVVDAQRPLIDGRVEWPEQKEAA